MSSTKIMFACALLFLTGCSVLQPFVDRRRNAGETDMAKLYVGRSTPTEPAICSNGFFSSEETIQALADLECIRQKTGTHAVLTGTSRFTCKLLLPTHTYFKCEK